MSIAAVGCGSTSNTYTAPSAVGKCAITIGSAGSTLPATGGTGSITVTTARECEWSASPDVNWLRVTAGGTGQGDGSVQFSANANPDPEARTGGIVLNGERAAITQAAAECRMELSSNSATFQNAGGSGTVEVRASSQRCAWSASADAAWITIRSGASGTGTGTVTFVVAPTDGGARTATLRIADQRFSVTQSQACSFAIAPDAYSAGAAGGAGQIAVTASAGCPWTASSTADWIAITDGASGSGAGLVRFAVAPTTGPSRSSTILAAGQLFTITQSQSCTYEVSPLSQSFDSSGGPGSVSVASAAGCAWTAVSSSPWIAVSGTPSGTGPGTVTFTVAPTTGGSRTGTLVVGGQTVTIAQAQGCSYSIGSERQSVGQSGGSGNVAVTAPPGCSWSASSAVSWITVTAGASGTGGGTVGFTVAANSGGARSGALTIAGRTFTVEQAGAAPACTYAVAPQAIAAQATGGVSTVTVTTSADCSWTAESGASWIAVKSGARGSGSGSVQLEVKNNNGPARTGTAVVAGVVVTIAQLEQACTYTVRPATVKMDPDGGRDSVSVTTDDSCGWTATSNVPWITIVSGASGSGRGVVVFAATESRDGREGTLTVAGQTVTVKQKRKD